VTRFEEIMDAAYNGAPQAHTVSYHARMTPLLLKRLEWVQER
jgi:hypothetical protein